MTTRPKKHQQFLAKKMAIETYEPRNMFAAVLVEDIDLNTDLDLNTDVDASSELVAEQSPMEMDVESLQVLGVDQVPTEDRVVILANKDRDQADDGQQDENNELDDWLKNRDGIPDIDFDIPPIFIAPGDANLDGQFNSSDLVQVFQAGKYEQDLPANWHEGDWNGDFRFDSSDLVFALEYGYEQPIIIDQPDFTCSIPEDGDNGNNQDVEDEFTKKLKKAVKDSKLGPLDWYEPDGPAVPNGGDRQPGFDCEDYAIVMDEYIESTFGDEIDKSSIIVIYDDDTAHAVNVVKKDDKIWIVDAQTGTVLGPFDDMDGAMTGIREFMLGGNGYRRDSWDDGEIRRTDEYCDWDDFPESWGPPFWEDEDLLERFKEKMKEQGVDDTDPYLPESVE